MSLPPELLSDNLHISKPTPTAAESRSVPPISSASAITENRISLSTLSAKLTEVFPPTVMDAPFTFNSSNGKDEFFNDAFFEPEGDLGGADLSAESALASPFAPSCMQGGDEAAYGKDEDDEKLADQVLPPHTKQPCLTNIFNFGNPPSAYTCYGAAGDILAAPMEAYDSRNGHALGTMTNQDSAYGSSDIRTAPVANNGLTNTAVASGTGNLGARGELSTELCSCPKCATYRGLIARTGRELWCTNFNCGYEYTRYHANHYKWHFKDEQDRYRCKAPNCDTTFGRWGELRRHYGTHCLKPTTFPCDVIGCKYGGENGFKRKDKLLSHKRNVHDGKSAPDQLMRMQKRKLAPKA